MSAELRQALERVARRLRLARLWWVLAACWGIWALAGLGMGAWLSTPGPSPISADWMLGAFIALVAATGIACAALALRSARDNREVARRIEAKYPELKTGLLAAIEEDAAAPPGPRGFLQAAVIQGAIDHGRSHDWGAAVSPWKLRGANFAHLAALGLLAFVVAGLVGLAWSRDFARRPGAAIVDPSGIAVEPGDAEIERGVSLLVVARFGDSVPGEATLVVEGADGSGAAARHSMTRSLEDPAFAGRVASVESDLSYRIEAGGVATKDYRVKVFEYPDVSRIDADLVFPAYTGLATKSVEDVRHVTAVEGTELTLTCRLNKDVASAQLVGEGREPIPLVADGGPDRAYRATFVFDETVRLRVDLVDREGRRNKSPIEVAVNVTKNRPAAVKMTRPAHDVRVSPVEELALAAQLDDDFGVVRHGISFTLAGRDPQDLVLKGPDPAPKRIEAKHQLDFEALGVAPDELVTYHFWAEDIGPDGKPRRSSGDMFFAEVRPFEEIFRQGEQPSSEGSESEGQQGGGNAQEAMQLAELQKQIINGTWKLIRREISAQPTEEFPGDVKLLRESQQSAIEQAGPLAERLRDAGSKASLDRAVDFMNDAAGRLGAAADAASPEGLNAALAAEQAAYQALLKLRDREFDVVRNRSQRQRGGGSASGSPSQRQLQQLELSNDEDRYEEQRTAARQEGQSQQDREQAELRQVLSRLRELAQRQADVNERLKELQSALEAAKDEQEREEIRRQLKRLRDQEQQILRDSDELQERMESEENRERMAEAREQVEQSREHTRQASEALEQGQVSQALTEGTRAGRQLENLREELRKESSNRFSEEMTAMRDQARRLDESQDKLTEDLEAADRNAQHSLRDEGRKEIREKLGEQKEQFDQLLERMKGTVQEAEETEARLAKELFDAARKAEERAISDALEAAGQLTDLGIAEEAAKASRHAAQGFDELREGVERAAESVLGDETAALRLAQGELENLSESVDREIGQSTGQDPAQREGNPAQGRQARDGEATKGERPEGGDAREGERRPGEGEGQGPEGQAQGEEGRPEDAGRQGEQQEQQGRRGDGQQGQPQGRGEQRRGQQDQQGRGEQQGQQGGRGEQQGQQGQQGQGEQQGREGQQGQGGGQGAQEGQQQPGGQQGGGSRGSGLDRLMEGLAGGPGGPGGPAGPIAGEGFREWSDRMRNVEELLEDPELRAEAARIRDRVRGAREEFKRHAKEPDWNQLKSLVAEPLRELSRRVAEEVARRESPDALVPIDRDPVPPQYAEGVRRYYERLGSGQ